MEGDMAKRGRERSRYRSPGVNIIGEVYTPTIYADLKNAISKCIGNTRNANLLEQTR